MKFSNGVVLGQSLEYLAAPESHCAPSGEHLVSSDRGVVVAVDVKASLLKRRTVLCVETNPRSIRQRIR